MIPCERCGLEWASPRNLLEVVYGDLCDDCSREFSTLQWVLEYHRLMRHSEDIHAVTMERAKAARASLEELAMARDSLEDLRVEALHLCHEFLDLKTDAQALGVSDAET